VTKWTGWLRRWQVRHRACIELEGHK
jgi:hypothetical protein